MKKICTTAIALSFLLPSFALGTKTGGVVGYYTFDEEIEDSIASVEIVDHSGNGNNVFTTAMDGTEFTTDSTGRGCFSMALTNVSCLMNRCFQAAGFRLLRGSIRRTGSRGCVFWTSATRLKICGLEWTAFRESSEWTWWGAV